MHPHKAVQQLESLCSLEFDLWKVGHIKLCVVLSFSLVFVILRNIEMKTFEE